MTIKHTVTAAIVSLAFGALSAQAEPFNDRTSHVQGFDQVSPSTRVTVQAHPAAFNDRGERFIEQVTPDPDLERRDVRVVESGFKNRSNYVPG